jgi:hypothetical protein
MGRPRQQNPPGTRLAIEAVSQCGEERGALLRFVDGDPSRMLAQETFDICRQQREVRRAVEIEVEPRRAKLSQQRTLAALSRAQDEHGGKRTQERAEARLRGSMEIVHALYF